MLMLAVAAILDLVNFDRPEGLRSVVNLTGQGIALWTGEKVGLSGQLDRLILIPVLKCLHF